jgi:hypothetical protein
MTGFNTIKSIYRMSRTLLGVVPPDFLTTSGTYEATLSYIAAPTELSGWLGRVIIPPHHTTIPRFIATPASVWYDKAAGGD